MYIVFLNNVIEKMIMLDKGFLWKGYLDDFYKYVVCTEYAEELTELRNIFIDLQ